MTKIEFLQLAASDRKEVFIEVATQTGMTPFAVEKDWWVSRCLEIIFQLDVAQHLVFNKSLASKGFKVPTVIPERTFLEKLFLLHEEFHRPEEKRRLNRLSRHIYDIYQLSKSGINEKSFHDKGLYPLKHSTLVLQRV